MKYAIKTIFYQCRFYHCSPYAGEAVNDYGTLLLVGDFMQSLIDLPVVNMFGSGDKTLRIFAGCAYVEDEDIFPAIDRVQKLLL